MHRGPSPAAPRPAAPPLLLVPLQQQVQRQPRVLEPAGGVQAGRQPVGDRLRVHVHRLDSGGLPERPQAGPLTPPPPLPTPPFPPAPGAPRPAQPPPPPPRPIDSYSAPISL